MPYPNEHACRLREPDDFEPGSFRRTKREHEGKPYAVIMGRLKGEETTTEQAYRYSKDDWSASEAEAHCEDHEGIEFEPASTGSGRAASSDGDRATFPRPYARTAEPVVRQAHDDGLGDPSGMERRFVASEVRVADGEDGLPHIRGYGAVFGEWSEPIFDFTEIIEPGAFTKTLKKADVRSLWNHDPNYILGRNKAKTLKLVQDERGLAYDATPPDAQWARDLLVSIKRGDVTQSSFGFRVIKDEWTQPEKSGGKVTRRLIELELFDVGPVTFPAYPQTSAEARARAEALRQAQDAEQALGDPGDDDGEAAARARLEIRRRRLELMEREL